jgi:hypothetical protein
MCNHERKCDFEQKLKNTLAGAAALALLAAGLGSPAMAATQTEIGVTSLVVKDVEGKTDAEIRQLALRDNVYRYETVNTGFESASELRFADDTRISVGPNSTIVLDEFVYDPDPGEGALVLFGQYGEFELQDQSLECYRRSARHGSGHGRPQGRDGRRDHGIRRRRRGHRRRG